jgi:hypothetical protein
MALLRRAPPPPPSRVSPLAASRRRCLLCGIWAVRSRWTVQIKRDRVPLRRSTVDQWTGSMGAGPRHGVMHVSALHQPCVSIASAQPTAARHVAPPQLTRRPPWQLCK